MSELSEQGQRIVSDMAGRHGFSSDAVTHMLVALANGGGTQAQFNHYEFGGMGQWSLGGMTMVGDMFNNQMKARVDSLCSDMSGQVQGASVFAPAASSQSQSQGGFSGQYQGGGSSLFVPQGGEWPVELGRPASQGAQNDMRYAYFPDRQRLAISVAGIVTIYDTADHQIGGFGQAQSGGQSLSFTSQHGLVSVSQLRVVSGDVGAAMPEVSSAPVSMPVSEPVWAPAAAPTPTHPAAPDGVPMAVVAADASDEQIFARIERLADFHQRGILSDEEFGTKKAELLARL